MTKRIHLTFYLIMFVLKYDYVSAVEGASDDSSEGIPTYMRLKLRAHLKLQLGCS